MDFVGSYVGMFVYLANKYGVLTWERIWSVVSDWTIYVDLIREVSVANVVVTDLMLNILYPDGVFYESPLAEEPRDDGVAIN